ncbi:LAFE_0E10616g1_1 [Lachancea fermentati]|uniref:LAFE_0E10616g1_1 n=1 Tax=Lachancea fermentati TaxID=4955 RepID=A0A1G4MDJ6_LACFM|nr:LAFE_0E10616g1_1 [Lachancea fermentati]
MSVWKALNTRRRKYRRSLIFALIGAAIWYLVQYPLKKHFVHTNEKIPYSKFDIGSQKDDVFVHGCLDPLEYIRDPQYQKQNATFVMLTRNQEIEGVLQTMLSIERHFNQWFQYPYVFLNDEPFSEEFRQQVGAVTTAHVRFGLVSEFEWEFPKEVRDSLLFKHSIDDQGDRGIMYGNMESYHKMCRFYSGLFYRHPMVLEYEWYWRIEPDVEFFCDTTYDPFWEMAKHGKKYGFTMVIKELFWTVPNLFRFTKSFIRSHGLQVGTLWKMFTWDYNVLSGDAEMNKLVNYRFQIDDELKKKVLADELLSRNYASDAEVDADMLYALVERSRQKVPIVEDKFDNEEFNLCHFWSNFEIARVDVFNNDLYNAYFQYLEESGGFWAERWGDAPVHSLGLALSLNLEDVHYFRDIGYQHSTLAHCPANKAGKQLAYTPNPAYKSVFASQDTIFARLARTGRRATPETNVGVGCRCDCPNRKEIEDTCDECFGLWGELLWDEHLPDVPENAAMRLKQLRLELRAELQNR